MSSTASSTDCAAEHSGRPPLTRVLTAVLIAPWAVVPAAVVLIPALSLFDGSFHGPVGEAFGAAVVIGVLGVVYAYVFTIFYGLPVYLLLRRFGRTGVVPVAIVAVAPVLVYRFWEDVGIWPMLGFAWFALAVGLSCRYLAHRAPEPRPPRR